MKYLFEIILSLTVLSLLLKIVIDKSKNNSSLKDIKIDNEQIKTIVDKIIDNGDNIELLRKKCDLEIRDINNNFDVSNKTLDALFDRDSFRIAILTS